MNEITEVITGVWRGSELAVFGEFKANRLGQFASIICLRRKLPVWWPSAVEHAQKHTTFRHFPIPPSQQADCLEKIQQLIFYVLPELNRPVLLFCKKGQNRSGMVSAVLRFQATNSIDQGIIEYVQGVNSCLRENEIAIVRELCVTIP